MLLNEDESVEEESVCEESEDVSAVDNEEGTIQYALRSPAKLYEGGAEETFVRQKETKRHSKSPNKIVKHVGIEYMHTKKNRERAMKRRVEGIKVKVKELSGHSPLPLPSTTIHLKTYTVEF